MQYRSYVHDSHEGIISKEKFLEVACEMNRRKNLTVKNDDEIAKKGRKYNPQNVLGNILECEECGAAFRRRTERKKVDKGLVAKDGEIKILFKD